MTTTAIQSGIAELRASIVHAFPVEPLPKRDSIIAHECEECWEVRDDFASQRWPDVTRETIDRHFDSLPLFTPTAHHYYLPAYLVRALDHEGQTFGTGGTVADFVIYNLSPDYTESWTSRFPLFSREQLRVVATWLEFVLSHQAVFDCDAVVGQRGFEQYWRNYVA